MIGFQSYIDPKDGMTKCKTIKTQIVPASAIIGDQDSKLSIHDFFDNIYNVILYT